MAIAKEKFAVVGRNHKKYQTEGYYVPTTEKLLAVTQDNPEAFWNVTHVPSGWAVSVSHETQASALHFARDFWDRLKNDADAVAVLKGTDTWSITKHQAINDAWRAASDDEILSELQVAEATKEKLKRLAKDWGLTVRKMLEGAVIDSVVPGICTNDGCDYSTEVEPDCRGSHCEICAGSYSVTSCLVLAGII